MNTIVNKKPSLAMCIYELIRLVEQGIPKKGIRYDMMYVEESPQVVSKIELEITILAKLGILFLIDENPTFRRILEKHFLQILKGKASKPVAFIVLWILTCGVDVSEETRQTIAKFKKRRRNRELVELCNSET